MKQIMIVKPGTVSSKDKEKLSKNNIILIEHPFPGDVRIVTDFSAVNGDDITMSALKAVNMGSKSEFFNELFTRIYKK